MVIQTVMHYAGHWIYDEKDKSTGNKTGKQKIGLFLMEINEKGESKVSTYFPSFEQIKTSGGIDSLGLMDKVQVNLELASMSAKPRFVELGDIVEKATITYHAMGEIKQPINREKKVS